MKKVFFNSSTADYDARVSGGLRFVPTGENVVALERDYVEMCAAGMILGEPPIFNDIIARLGMLADTINHQPRGGSAACCMQGRSSQSTMVRAPVVTGGSVDDGDVRLREFASMDALGASATGAGEVLRGAVTWTTGGVDVGQAVEDQRRLVGDDGTSPRPDDGKCEIVVLRARQDGHLVHPSGHVLEETAAGEQAQLRRIDACLSSLERRDVAVVIRSCLHESVGLAVAGGYRRMCVVPPILCTLLRQVPGGSSCKDP